MRKEQVRVRRIRDFEQHRFRAFRQPPNEMAQLSLSSRLQRDLRPIHVGSINTIENPGAGRNSHLSNKSLLGLNRFLILRELGVHQVRTMIVGITRLCPGPPCHNAGYVTLR